MNPVYKCEIPFEMVKGPYMIHFNGLLIQPGHNNDYTIDINSDKTLIFFWDPMVNTYKEKIISITDLNTGNRWAWSSEEGVFVDTRKFCR